MHVYFPFSENSNQGAVYLFNISGHLAHKFTASDAQANDQFGTAVASFGEVIIVGAHRCSKDGVKSGAAYIFNLDSRAEVRKLTPNDGTAGDQFGFGVAIFESVIMVTARSRGSGRVYTFDALNGTQLVKFINTDGPQKAGFGRSLAMHQSTNVGIVGHMAENIGGTKTGAVYIFDLRTGIQLRKIKPPALVDYTFSTSGQVGH